MSHPKDILSRMLEEKEEKEQELKAELIRVYFILREKKKEEKK